uniref:Phosphatidylcholine transfer protein n=1 Tax=Timema bartmani TaxID=61472 RepID=A0A7R9F070_9NEOP|nr:unnamed protein product [Timema bartmani]
MRETDAYLLMATTNWVPFIEREDLLIWRKDYNALYAYKVYGNYNDVTAEDFLQVQIDTEYRKQWDNTAVNLQILESDPKTTSNIVYWEMQWPRLFANRDYVFNRRYVVDWDRKLIVVMNQSTSHPECPAKSENHRVKEYWSYMVIKAYTSFSERLFANRDYVFNRRYVVDWDRKLIVVMNQSTSHPECPAKSENHRVKEYWSYMVIKAYTSFSEPGIEFSLTYFDDAGVSIPSSVTAWVAMSGLPDFMSRLRQAAREFYSLRKSNPKFVTALESKHQPEKNPAAFTPDTVASPPSPPMTDPQKDGPYFHQFQGMKLFL